MFRFFVIILLVAQAFVSRAQGIEFFHGTWEEALKMAKEQNKLIFMDAYTSWCGPCKQMSANVFPLPNVGTFHNANFINMKVDMEKGEGPKLAQKYYVTAYPTLLYIDGEGKTVLKEMGMRSGDALVELGKSALKKIDKSGDFAKEYEGGKREPEFLRKYAYSLMQSGKDYAKVANEYARSQTDWKTEVNKAFLFDFSNFADSYIFDKMLDNKALIEEFKGKEAVVEKVKNACAATVKRAAENKLPELLQSAKNAYTKFDAAGSPKFATKADLTYHKLSGDNKAFAAAASKYASKYIKNDAAELLALINDFMATKPDKKGISKACEWAKWATVAKQSHDTWFMYGSLLHQLGKDKDALKMLDKAILNAAAEQIKPFMAQSLKQQILESQKKK